LNSGSLNTTVKDSRSLPRLRESEKHIDGQMENVMGRYILNRLISLLFVVWMVSVITFVLV
jgi:hypothetical protein